MIKLIRAKTLYDDNVKYYQLGDLNNVQCGEYYIGETCFGEDIVEIICNKTVEMSPDQWDSMIKSTKKSHFSFEPRLLRKAIDSEIDSSRTYRESAHEYKDVFEQKIKEYKIDLRIVKFHYTLLKDRLICIYVAPGRVDFRAFVKDLGHILKQRIELFQIPFQGITIPKNSCEMGSCGRQLCCATFCNPTKCKTDSISKSPKNLGCCGRIKCCLRFEE